MAERATGRRNKIGTVIVSLATDAQGEETQPRDDHRVEAATRIATEPNESAEVSTDGSADERAELARSPSLMTVSIRALSLSKGRCP